MSNYERPLELDINPEEERKTVKTDTELFKEITEGSNKERNGRYASKGEIGAVLGVKLPSLKDACDDFISEIQEEYREDVTVDTSYLSIDSDGGLSYFDNEGSQLWSIAGSAYKQLAGKCPRTVDNADKYNVNKWISHVQGRSVLRTMKDPGDAGRRVYSVVTDRYQPLDADVAAELMKAAMPVECMGQVRYTGDGGRYEIRAIIKRPLDVAGEDHLAQICLRSADDGTSAQRIYLRMFRLKCTNGMYAAKDGLLGRVPHITDKDVLVNSIQESFEKAREAIDRFSQHWGLARGTQYKDPSGESVGYEEAIKRIVHNKIIHVPYMRRDTLEDRIRTAYSIEPEDSMAGVINAVTRTAHMYGSSWKSPWYQDDLEEQAGQLLYNVRTLSPVADEDIF